MILCNLSGLMAAKKINISEVSRRTGISRTTLTSLYHNSYKGIQMETLDTLCKFFDVTPDKVFLFSKYDINISIDNLNSESIFYDEKTNMVNVTICINVSNGEVSKAIDVAAVLYVTWHEEDENTSACVSLDLDVEYFVYDQEDTNFSNEKKDNEFLFKILSSMPHEIQSLISDQITDKVVSYYEADFGEYRVNDVWTSTISLWNKGGYLDNGEHQTPKE